MVISKKTFIVMAIVAVLLVASYLIIKSKSSEQTTSTGGSGGSGTTAQAIAPIAINYGNIGAYLSSISLVQAIPSGTTISLSFYNFDTGQRQLEKSYVLTTGKAVEGSADNADIKLSLHSKYIGVLNGYNFCSVVQAANKNGDLGFDTSLSTLQLAWKFKSMYSYRDCLGF